MRAVCSLPRLARAHYRREVVAWLLISTMMGSVTGGVIGVIVKNAYAGRVPEQWLNVAVALVTGAQAFMLLTSFLWASLSHGRHKIRFLASLQAAAAILVAHSHPSGDASPSPEDTALTREIVAAGELLGIECLDHVVVGHQRYVSLRERGLGFS